MCSSCRARAFASVTSTTPVTSFVAKMEPFRGCSRVGRTDVPCEHRATHTTRTLPARNVGATRWVARGGVAGGHIGMMRSHDDRIHPHPALGAGLSLAGRGVFSLPCNCDVQTVTPSHQPTSTPLPRPG